VIVNPSPTLTSISPTSTAAGSATTTLTLIGTSFITSSTVNWNGSALTTTYGSSTSLTATVPTANLITAGTSSVTVVNPTPGGGTSGGQTFTITSAGGHNGYTYERPITVTSTAMTLHFVQGKGNSGTVSSTATTVATPFGVTTTAGNMLVVGVTNDTTDLFTGLSDTLGSNFTLAAKSTSTTPVYLYYATSTAGGADTVTATFGNATSARVAYMVIGEYMGLASAPLDATMTTNVASANLGPVTTTVSSDLLIGVARTNTQPNFAYPSAQRGSATYNLYLKLADDDPTLTRVPGGYYIYLSPAPSIETAAVAAFKTSGGNATSLTNFPVLVSTTQTTWGYPGQHIQNLTTSPSPQSIQEPADLIFTSDSGCTTPLNYETEYYSSTTGALMDWVQVPTLAAGTTIYACYGNSSVTTNQSQPTSTWDTNFKGVWHLDDNAASTAVLDSTRYADNLTGQYGTSNNATTTAAIGPSAFTFGGTSTTAPTYASSTSANLTFIKNITWDGWLDTATTASRALMGQTINGGLDIRLTNSKLASNKVGYTGLGTSMSTIAVGNWTHFAFTLNNSSPPVIAIYINGQLENVAANTNGLGSASGFDLGNSLNINGTGALPWIGQLDEVRVASTSRSQNWIWTEYYNQSSTMGFETIGNEQ
jgi:hypothetical protein